MRHALAGRSTAGSADACRNACRTCQRRRKRVQLTSAFRLLARDLLNRETHSFNPFPGYAMQYNILAIDGLKLK